MAAVATNFAHAMSPLSEAFAQESTHSVRVVTGSTGKLYAQVVAGAPFDVLLAADQERPERLQAEGLAVAGSRFTYATGRIVLWSADPVLLQDDAVAVLSRGHFRRLAIANPSLAPYGVAAQQVLEQLGLWAQIRPRIVMGENVGQAHAMVATGNAELGFIALSALTAATAGPGGSAWEVPPALYEPIRQDAALLGRAQDNPAARALLSFLRSPAARHIIRKQGYGAGSE